MKPASVLLESKSESGLEARPAPAFLVLLEPWHTVFFRNLGDVFRPRQQAPFLVSSRPGSFWSDVFVTSHLPWNRFAQSAICHVALIVALWGSVRLWPQTPQVLDRPVFSRSDVIYYAPSEYLPPLDTGGARRALPRKGEPEHSAQPIISVPAEADNRTQTIVTPSDIKLNHDVPLPNIVAWSQNKAQPAVPLASTAAAANTRLPAFPVTAVAPTPETMPANRQRAPMLSQTAVAPAPDVDAESSRSQSSRSLQAPQAAILQPPPSVDAASQRSLGDINIGRSQVVAPAPELPVAEQYAAAGRAQTALGSGAGSAAVPPPPSIQGNAGSNGSGRIISLGIHPAAMSPAEMPAGNRRGTFAATPAGKTGAPGTPDVAASANHGSNSGAGNHSDGIPSGLTVGAGPENQNRSAVAGAGNGAGGATAAGHSSDNSRLIADATPPRVSANPPHSLSEVSKDRATDVDRWIFGDKKFYAMTLNMPNLNSAGGSWVIRFAELNPNDAKGDLTAPEATQKVDPAYPLELMRRNVQGTVTLYAVIRNDGSVSDVRVLRGVDDQLDQYARAALGHWHFRPATKNGAAVDLEAVVMIPFKPVRLKSSF
jgi:TonB family protein